jgi:hypothetical protein
MLLPFFKQTAAAAVPSAITGLAGAATFGFLGAGGSPRGIPAGISHSVGGAASGAVSGATLGGFLGAGLVGAAIGIPAFRGKVGSFLASAGRSPTVQRVGARMAAAPIGGQAQGSISRFLKAARTTPHSEAAAFTIELLEQKQHRFRMLATGGAFGAIGGMMAGMPLGMARRAYVGGRRETGPMNYGA